MKRIIGISVFCLSIGLFAVGCGSTNKSQQRDYPEMQQNQPGQNIPRNNENNSPMNQNRRGTTPPTQSNPATRPRPTGQPMNH